MKNQQNENAVPNEQELEVRTEEYMSDLFGTKPAKVVSLTLYRKYRQVAAMDFVLKDLELTEGIAASVSASGGTIGGMAKLIAYFIETYQPATLVNQVYKPGELKAMYRVGVKLILPNGRGAYPLRVALQKLKERQAIGLLVRWNGEAGK